jgi:hypothetical protein
MLAISILDVNGGGYRGLMLDSSLMHLRGRRDREKGDIKVARCGC